MKILIFRIAKGEPGGIINSSCPIDFEKQKPYIKNELNKIVPTKIDYDNNGYKNYLDKELWECKKLRQGWGIPELDLRLGEENWIKNYIFGLRKYWNVSLKDIEEDNKVCYEAAGRFKMFNETLNSVDDGDIVIIPTHSQENHHDPKHFTIATVNGQYYFDLNEDYNDFGHVLPVKNLKTIAYNSIIEPMSFTGFYQRAVTELKPEYKLYPVIQTLLKKYY